ncbi:SMI1/KNR4 family protein [Methylomonas sp. EbB]|uniref:SMI1/KNR4 family protein n=1 Tax=Methylomonas fluvii TaxID=1854564 RepID=A0ABR9D7X8_9GAMM|nr:SMI1/KNR4 family protein [Methylomonas fluvii]
MRNNGGFPNSNYVKGNLHVFSIDGFIPIKYGFLPIERLVRDMQVSEPDGCFLPFANDAGGNIFYMSLLDDDYERVYLLTTDTADKIYVCGSFDEFVAALYNE